MRSVQKTNGAPSLRRFKPYPNYKDSGVEWLGKIPENWQVKRVKHLAHIVSGFAPPESYDRSTGEYPVYGSNGLIGYCNEYLVSKETLAVGRVGASGSVNVVPTRSWVSDNALLLQDLSPTARLSWLRYVLETMNLGTQAAKNAQPIITGTFLGNQTLATPPEPEQRTIAAFLDRETAKIDTLVAKKEQVIDLLQEKRTALITRAVTKGLNPNVPMKNSGVEWLGEIPKHWKLKRFKHLLFGTIQNGLFKKKEHFGVGTLLVNVFDVYRDDFLVNLETLERVQADEAEQRLYAVKAGDLFFVRSSLKLEGVGRSACMTAVPEPAVFECHLVRARPNNSDIESKFMINFLNSLSARQRLVSLANTVTMSTMPQTAIATLEVPVPPVPEQHSITAFIERETTKIDALMAKVREAIERLKEYRTALISAAVTGKIDVQVEVG